MRRAAALLAIFGTLITTCASARAAMPASQIVAGGRIASIAERAARALLTDPERAVAPAFAIADQTVPLGEVAIEAGEPQFNATYVSVPVAISVDGKIARRVFAGYRLTTFVHTAVAARDLAPGSILTSADLRLARLPSNGRPAVEISVLLGRKVRAATSRGAQLYVEQTSVNELVKAGSPVVLIVHDGPVALSADVVARTGGGLGETVTIYNPQTQKSLSGVITGPNVVEITLPGANS
ncbi:MAG: hypothetical protein NVSMB5_13540 [Candidatus Velthaea sp.]